MAVSFNVLMNWNILIFNKKGKMEHLSDHHIKIRLQIDHPIFGMLRIDEFNRCRHNVCNLKKGDKFLYLGNEYTLSQDSIILDPYRFAIIVIKDPSAKLRLTLKNTKE